MTVAGRHAQRAPVPRAGIATALVVLVLIGVGITVAVPAHQNYDQKEQAIAQSQELASKVLLICQEGGPNAAPLVAIQACPLAQQVHSTPIAAPANTLTSDQVQSLIRAEIARQLPRTTTAPVVGGVAPGPSVPPSVAGPSGRGSYPSTTTVTPPPPRTFFEHAPARITITEPPPATRVFTRTREAPPPPVTQTVIASPPVTVTQPAPVTVTQQAPAPIQEPAEQQIPQPTTVNQGGLLPAVNTLLSGL